MRKIFYNSLLAKCLLLFGYGTAMMLGSIHTKRDRKNPLSEEVKRHESTHCEQYWEITMIAFIVALGLQIAFGGGWWFVAVPFVYYVLYFLEAAFTCVIRLFTHGWSEAMDFAYDNSMFEQEACLAESDPTYNERRRFCAFLRFFGKI